MEDSIKIFLIPEYLREIFLPLLLSEMAEDARTIFGAVDMKENVPVGVMAVEEYNEGWEILYIGVKEERRRKGIGRALVEYVALCMKGILGETLLAACAALPGEDSSEAISFFKACGFTVNSASDIRRFQLGDINYRLLKSSKGLAKYRCITLSDLKKDEWRSLVKKVAKRGENAPASDNGIYMRIGEKSAYHEQTSIVAFNEKGQPRGCLLTKPHPDGLVLSYLLVFGMSEESAKLLGFIIRSAYKKAVDIIGMNSFVYLNPQSDVTKRMLAKICNKKDESYRTIIELTRVVYE